MAKSRVYLVKVKTGSGEYTGEFHSPYPDRRISDVIAKLTDYMTLKNVTCGGDAEERYPFIIISKNSIETIIVLKEQPED